MQVVLVEDNPGDIIIINEILNEMDKELNLTILKDGSEAIQFFNSKSDKFDLIITDLNLPCYDGFQVLDTIRKNENIKEIPVIFFTTSISNRDREKAIRLGATAYITKPHDFDDYSMKVKSFLDLIPPA